MDRQAERMRPKSTPSPAASERPPAGLFETSLPWQAANQLPAVVTHFTAAGFFIDGQGLAEQNADMSAYRYQFRSSPRVAALCCGRPGARIVPAVRPGLNCEVEPMRIVQIAIASILICASMGASCGGLVPNVNDRMEFVENEIIAPAFAKVQAQGALDEFQAAGQVQGINPNAASRIMALYVQGVLLETNVGADGVAGTMNINTTGTGIKNLTEAEQMALQRLLPVIRSELQKQAQQPIEEMEESNDATTRDTRRSVRTEQQPGDSRILVSTVSDTGGDHRVLFAGRRGTAGKCQLRASCAKPTARSGLADHYRWDGHRLRRSIRGGRITHRAFC